MSMVIGVDIGGSKTHGIRVGPDGAVLAEQVVGSANVESVSVEQAESEINSLFDVLGRSDVDVVCVGSAGINTAVQESWLHGLISRHVPGAHVLVVHDTRLILATREIDDGIAVICGTGSVAWGRAPDGRTARAGGWGFLLGDEGSGYWVTRQAVRHALGLADAGGDPDPLSQALQDACEVASAHELLARFYAEPTRRLWAHRAAVVFQVAAAGDPAAGAIVDTAAEAVAGLIQSVAAQLSITGPVALGGGLVVHQTSLRESIERRLHAAGITDVEVLRREPVWGAVYLARKALQRP